MDVFTLSQAKEYTNLTLLGFTDVAVNGTTVTFTFQDGTTADVTLPTPADGKSVTGVNINANGELICTLSDGTTLNAGTVPAVKGDTGERGERGETGADGKSAYDVWLEQGNTGTEAEFLESLKGERGEKGADGTMTFADLTDEQKESLKGDKGDTGADGKSAYELWLEAGNTGSEDDFFNSLKGDTGADGQTGADGFSPVVTVTDTDNGHKVSIEDSEGVKEFEVLDGVVAEILHTDLTGFDGITTVLDLVNALLEEYRTERKNVRFESGSLSNTNLTDLPQAYGYLTIKVGGTNIVEVTFAYSNVGFKSMYYGYLNRASSETLYSSLTWKVINTDSAMKSYSSLSDLGLDTTATINDIIAAMANNSMFVYKTDVFDYATEYENLQYATVTIHKQSTNRVQVLMTDKDTGNLYVGRLDSNNKVNGWTKIITEKSDPYACTSYKALNGTEDLFTLPCGHYVSANINTTYNYPITDTNVTAHIYVLGCLNDPANNKGYRIILYFDNKGRMYRINEWWGVFTDNGWKEIATKTVTSLAELGLTADATFQDVISALPKGSSALLGVTEFTNYQTIFPYEEGNDQFARVYIVKGAADGSRMYARWFRKDGVKEAIAIFNINDNKFGGWNEYIAKSYVDNLIANLQAQIDELKAKIN